MYGVVILTMNEERALPDALSSIPSSCTVSIVDSGSTDRTVDIAEEAGASVLRNDFTGFGDQRNFAIKNAPDDLEWQLHLDADERMTPALHDAIVEILGGDDLPDGFALPNRTMLNGKWLRYSSGYPVYQTRLVRRSTARFMNMGHGQQETPETEVRRLDVPYVHEAFVHGLDAWIAKHNEYSTKEVDLDRAPRRTRWSLDVLSPDPIKRRRALREAARSLPFLPSLRLLHALVVQKGILDGHAGIQYARMLALYEQMKQLKRYELREPAPWQSAD